MSLHAVASLKDQPKTRFDFLNVNAENNVLAAETVQSEFGYIFEDELDHKVFRPHVVSVLIYFLGHLPGMDAHRRVSRAVQVKTNNFCVVKNRPISKPIMKLGGPFHSCNFGW